MVIKEKINIFYEIFDKDSLNILSFIGRDMSLDLDGSFYIQDDI
jgi:predicted membrane protein